MGGLNTALFLGQFVTPILTQPLVEQVGVAGAFGVAGGVSLLLAALVVGAARMQSIKPVARGNISAGK